MQCHPSHESLNKASKVFNTQLDAAYIPVPERMTVPRFHMGTERVNMFNKFTGVEDKCLFTTTQTPLSFFFLEELFDLPSSIVKKKVHSVGRVKRTSCG